MHDLMFSAHTINCVCHSIRSMFRVLGMYNFANDPQRSGPVTERQKIRSNNPKHHSFRCPGGKWPGGARISCSYCCNTTGWNPFWTLFDMYSNSMLKFVELIIVIHEKATGLTFWILTLFLLDLVTWRSYV